MVVVTVVIVENSLNVLKDAMEIEESVCWLKTDALEKGTMIELLVIGLSDFNGGLGGTG